MIRVIHIILEVYRTCTLMEYNLYICRIIHKPDENRGVNKPINSLNRHCLYGDTS